MKYLLVQLRWQELYISMAINGMSFSVTLPILFIPPIIISAIRIIIIIPIIRLIYMS